MVQNQTSQATRQSAPTSLTADQRELLKIAEEYGYPENLIPSLRDIPELRNEILEANRKGIKPTVAWLYGMIQMYP